MPRAPMVITVRVCPLCGTRPLSGVLRVEGDSGKRFPALLLLLPGVGVPPDSLPHLWRTGRRQAAGVRSGTTAHIRVEACDTCKCFLTTIDLTKDGHASPRRRLAAIPLSLWAHEHGYFRLQPTSWALEARALPDLKREQSIPIAIPVEAQGHRGRHLSWQRKRGPVLRSSRLLVGHKGKTVSEWQPRTHHRINVAKARSTGGQPHARVDKNK